MRFFSNTTLENEVCRPKSGINLYPFGMEMPGRKWQGTSDKYRYGMNTQEKDDEIFEGAMGAEFWEYDSRIGRRWNIDPEYKLFANESPYAVFHNNPIFYNDIKGNKPGNPDKEAKKFGKKVDKMYNKKHKKDGSYSREDAIRDVYNKLSDRQKYIVFNDLSKDGTRYAAVDIAEYYKATLKTSSKTETVPFELKEITILNKSDAKTFDESYQIKEAPGAISSQVELMNTGTTKGKATVTVFNKDGDGSTSKSLEIDPGKSASFSVTNKESIQIEYQKESTSHQGKHASFETKPTSVIKVKSEAYSTYEKYPSNTKHPNLNEVKNYLQHK